ncbi:DUF1810 domain-containing protein [Lachnospiraceae bacterium 45-P1]
MDDRLERFHAAQRGDYQSALQEIRAGRKRGHWMWYIFPQLVGLGRSRMAQYYAVRDLEEAKAYMDDSILGQNLIEISQALLEIDLDDALAVMGWPDNLKLKSSMTLFELAKPECKVFGKVLDKFYQGKRDERTIELLGGSKV